MHIITNLYFRIILSIILKSKFTKNICIIHNHSFYTNKIYVQFNLFMKVNSLFCFVLFLSCWDFLNQNVSCNVIGTFENL
jgi:hypothetical protein